MSSPNQEEKQTPPSSEDSAAPTNTNTENNNNNNNNNTTGDDQDKSSASSADKDYYTLHETDYETLLAEGFSDNAIKKAVSCGCIDDETCRKWLFMHLDHPELNTPLAPNIVVTIKEKVKLTPEQRAAKVAELKNKIAARKEEEAKAKLLEDKNRMQDGKLAREGAEARARYKREQEERERKREKEADRIAKEKVLFDLEVDRLVRTGLTPEDATRQATEKQEKRREEAKRIALEAFKRDQEEEEKRKAAGGGGGGGAGGGEGDAQKPKWDLSAFVQRNDALPASPLSGGGNNNQQQQAGGGGGGGDTIMSMFASSAGFYPKEMEDYTPFPDFIPTKKFSKMCPNTSLSSSSSSEAGGDVNTNTMIVPDFDSATSAKEILKTLATGVKDQVTTTVNNNSNAGEEVAAVFSTLRRIIIAIRDNLTDPKVRSLKPAGGLFRKHLSAYPQTLLFLRAVGFQKYTAAVKPSEAGGAAAPPVPSFNLFYTDVSLLFAAVAALEEVEAGK